MTLSLYLFALMLLVHLNSLAVHLVKIYLTKDERTKEKYAGRWSSSDAAPKFQTKDLKAGVENTESEKGKLWQPPSSKRKHISMLRVWVLGSSHSMSITLLNWCESGWYQKKHNYNSTSHSHKALPFFFGQLHVLIQGVTRKRPSVKKCDC